MGVAGREFQIFPGGSVPPSPERSKKGAFLKISIAVLGKSYPHNKQTKGKKKVHVDLNLKLSVYILKETTLIRHPPYFNTKYF